MRRNDIRINKSYADWRYQGVKTVVDMGTLCCPEGTGVGVAWYPGFPPKGRKKIQYTTLSKFAAGAAHEVTEWMYF